jgi:enoyl-CoA hydratase/carnithine racemase
MIGATLQLYPNTGIVYRLVPRAIGASHASRTERVFSVATALSIGAAIGHFQGFGALIGPNLQLAQHVAAKHLPEWTGG